MQMPLGQILYRRRCYCAWLGIVAILMLFVAPAVSVSLALSHEQNAAVMADSAMDMAHLDHVQHRQTDAHHDTQAAHAEQHGASHHEMMMEHAACGYCVLLIHQPLLSTVFNVDIRAVLLLVEIPPTLFIYSKILDDTYSESQPRAPPRSYS